jgi:geranylgeranyl pyrophosphate synthase
VETLHDLGSFRYASSVAERYANDAVACARSMEDVPERQALEALIDFVVARIPSSAAA